MKNHIAVATITKGDGSYSRYDLRTATSDTKYKLHCAFEPANGVLIQGEARAETYKEDGENRALVISTKGGKCQRS